MITILPRLISLDSKFPRKNLIGPAGVMCPPLLTAGQRVELCHSKLDAVQQKVVLREVRSLGAATFLHVYSSADTGCGERPSKG